MTESEQLSKFQAVLLDTLSESRTPEDWLTALLASPSSAPFRDYVAGRAYAANRTDCSVEVG